MTIREDEIAAEAMGSTPSATSSTPFCFLPSARASSAPRRARPELHRADLGVPLIMTITMIVMVLFGGKGTIWGPVLERSCSSRCRR